MNTHFAARTAWGPVFVLALAALLLGGCPGDDVSKPRKSQAVSEADVLGPAPGGIAQAAGGAPVNVTVQGSISYARYTAGPAGLSSTTTSGPCVNVPVEIVAHHNIHQVLGATLTDNLGAYSITFSTTRDFYVRARAQTTHPDYTLRVFHSQTSPAIVHAVSSPICNRAAGNQTVDVQAGVALPDIRAGAFVLLETARRLCEAASYPGSPTLGALEVFWAPGNIGTRVQRDQAGLPITFGTGYRAPADSPHNVPCLFFVGGLPGDVGNSDHDEFDDTVVAHEFCHFLMRSFSRDNNWGGGHDGERIVAGAAYSEGLPNALGCRLLGVDEYFDSVGLPAPAGSTALGYFLDLENPSLLPGVSGYEAEFSVSAICWDLLDGAPGAPASTDGDPVALPLDQFLDSMYGLGTRTGTHDVIWLPSLLQQLIDDARLTPADAHTLAQSQGDAFPPALPAQWPDPLSLPGGAAGTLQAGTGPGTSPPNAELGVNANAVYRLELAAGQSVTFTLDATPTSYADSAHRLELYVYRLDGSLLATQQGSARNKLLTLPLTPGVYVVRVHHAAINPQATSFTLQVQ